MIDWKALPSEEREALKSDVYRRREVYRGSGIDALVEMILSAGVFESIDPSNTAGNACRNFVLSIMEGMDLVNESTLPLILEYMLSLPVGSMHAEE